ncbi:peptide chain release factor N(5)-glutamine methyltransferase [Candidatus Pelagibacter sp.]|nr:peptide chain release factor N(5)-glutamine methyltransferase [Candidatus Pelagibacter sp.]
MNIENILNSGIKTLNKFNIKNPQLDCELLLSKVIQKDSKYFILNLKENLDKIYLNKFNSLVKRRANGEPLAYLINKKDFWKETFYVDKSVLIPRPDTEHMVEDVLKNTQKNSKLHILDIGTGSGCILLSILKERQNFRGTALDISKKCIKISKYNAKKLQLYDRIKFYISDVDNFNIGKYDIIISNPPYIENLSLKYLDKDVINFEPKLALSGGCDGFSKINKVINRTSTLIKRNGLFFLEIGYKQKNKVIDLLKRKSFYIKKVLKDYGRNDRCIVSIKL